MKTGDTVYFRRTREEVGAAVAPHQGTVLSVWGDRLRARVVHAPEGSTIRAGDVVTMRNREPYVLNETRGQKHIQRGPVVRYVVYRKNERDEREYVKFSGENNATLADNPLNATHYVEIDKAKARAKPGRRYKLGHGCTAAAGGLMGDALFVMAICLEWRERRL